jgi:molybdopterin synthase sulfur carrier subunit
MIRLVLPAHLRQLANVDREVELEVASPVTQSTILEALEVRYPMLRGTLRDRVSHKRRDYIRFFACGQDLSLEDPDTPVPEPVARGSEKFMIVGAMAGG